MEDKTRTALDLYGPYQMVAHLPSFSISSLQTVVRERYGPFETFNQQ